MENKIILSIQHNNATRMAYFLNRVEADLVEAPFEWRSWKKSEYIQDGCRFVSVDLKEPLTISILFCNSYHEACDIAKANALPSVSTAKWSVNGDVMYFVESKDDDKVSEVLSLFAGEE